MRNIRREKERNNKIRRLKEKMEETQITRKRGRVKERNRYEAGEKRENFRLSGEVNLGSRYRFSVHILTNKMPETFLNAFPFM